VAHSQSVEFTNWGDRNTSPVCWLLSSTVCRVRTCAGQAWKIVREKSAGSRKHDLAVLLGCVTFMDDE
jgi:hypothetical protein